MLLKRWERMGLQYLTIMGYDVVGVIDTDEKASAALGWERLKDRGFVSSTPSIKGPIYRITETGRRALEMQ